MGQKSIVHDATGTITGCYDSIDSPLPSLAFNILDITEDQYRMAMSVPGGWSAWNVENKSLVKALPPIPKPPTLVQQATSLLQGTVEIHFTPDQSGAFTIRQADIAHLHAVITGILLNGSFPNNANTYTWKNASGVEHTFQTIAEFKEFATAILDIVASCYAVINGTSTSLPNPVISLRV